MTTYPEKHFGITCPEGSKFFANPTAQIPFIGCCEVDMLMGDCPEGKLVAMSFDSSKYNEIPSQDCVSADNGAQWYVCAESNPTFIGCCDIDACGFRGCPSTLVRSAMLSKNGQHARQFMGVSNGVSSSSTSASTVSSGSTETDSTGVSPVATSTSSSTISASDSINATATSESHSSRNGITSGAIGGIAVGSSAGALGLGLLFFWVFRMARKRSNPAWHSSPTDSAWDGKYAGPSPASATASQLSPLQQVAHFGPHSLPSSHPRHSPNISELPATPVGHTTSILSSVRSQPSYSGVNEMVSPPQCH